MTGHPQWVARALMGAAVVGIWGWFGLLGLGLVWLVQPANLPTVTQPVEVLNLGNRVQVNDTLLMRFEVNKPVPREPVHSTRYLACASGNLVTLTSTPTQLPVGQYTVVSDSVIIPSKVTPGDVCRYTIEVTYRINPIREESVTLTSEPFTIVEESQ